MADILSNIYYDIWNPNSFRSIKLLLENARQYNNEITYDDVKDWLSSQPTFTKYHNVKTKFKVMHRLLKIKLKIQLKWVL
jgi:hypothetical protein